MKFLSLAALVVGVQSAADEPIDCAIAQRQGIEVVELHTGENNELECHPVVNDGKSLDELFDEMIDDMEEEDPEDLFDGEDPEIGMVELRSMTGRRPSQLAWIKLKDEPNFLPGIDDSRKKRILTQRLKGYGCWCNPKFGKAPYPDHAMPHDGHAVDELDEACRKLTQCQKCLNIEDAQCPSSSGFAFLSGDKYPGKTSCDNRKNRSNQCRMNACKCAEDFANNIRDVYLGSNWSFNGEYFLHRRFWKKKEKRGEPSMDYEGTCTTVASGGRPLECCGPSFPNKKPYDPTERSCCSKAARAYTMAFQECCADGRVRPLGECV